MYCNPLKEPGSIHMRRVRPFRRDKRERQGSYNKMPPSAAKIDLIIDVVCEYFGVQLYALKGPCRAKELNEARKFIYFFIRKFEPNASLKHIGKLFNRTHASVINGIESFNDLHDTSSEFILHAYNINRKLKEIKEPTEKSTNNALNINQ